MNAAPPRSVRLKRRLDEFEVFRLWLAANDKGLYAHDTWLNGEGVAGEYSCWEKDYLGKTPAGKRIK